MDDEKFKKLIQQIVEEAAKLKDAHTNAQNAPVNYACIFSQSEIEHRELTKAAQAIGRVVKETKSGLLYRIEDLDTVAGILRILKIRMPDPTRPERGDADFTVAGYQTFKSIFSAKPGFKLIQRPNMEMVELIDPKFDVRVYFSHPPLDQQLGIAQQDRI